MQVSPAHPDTLILVSVEYAHVPADTAPGRSDALAPGGPSAVAIPGAIPFALVWGSRLLTASGIFTAVKICVTDARNHGVTARTAERCTWEAAGVIAGGAVSGKLVPAVKVVALRHSLYHVLLGSITHRRLAAIFNKGTKPTFQEAVNLLADYSWGELFDKIVKTILDHR
jgi:hypothetical protein